MQRVKDPNSYVNYDFNLKSGSGRKACCNAGPDSHLRIPVGDGCEDYGYWPKESAATACAKLSKNPWFGYKHNCRVSNVKKPGCWDNTKGVYECARWMCENGEECDDYDDCPKN
jgi:hypothetical protein